MNSVFAQRALVFVLFPFAAGILAFVSVVGSLFLFQIVSPPSGEWIVILPISIGLVAAVPGMKIVWLGKQSKAIKVALSALVMFVEWTEFIVGYMICYWYG